MLACLARNKALDSDMVQRDAMVIQDIRLRLGEPEFQVLIEKKLGSQSTDALIGWLDDLFPAEQSDPAMENIPQPQSLGADTEEIFAEETPILAVPISSYEFDPIPVPPATVEQLPEPPSVSVSPVVQVATPPVVESPSEIDEITEERPPRRVPVVRVAKQKPNQPTAVVDWDEEEAEHSDDFTTDTGEDWAGYTEDFYTEQDLKPMLIQHFAAALVGAMGMLWIIQVLM
jgi:hypothetical protein